MLYLIISCTPDDSTKAFADFLSQPYQHQTLKLKCRKCKTLATLTISERIVRYPKYLMLVFQRINPINGKRIDGFVDYPRSFVQFDPQSSQEIKYTLNNVIINRPCGIGIAKTDHYF